MTLCPVVSLIGTEIVELAAQATSANIDAPADIEVGDFLYLSVNKDDEAAGYVAAVIDGGDPDWVVLAGGQTDHFWKRVDAGDIGATYSVAFGPGARYAVLTLAAFRCTNTTSPVVDYDTDSTGVTEVTTHPVPGLTAPDDDYLLIAGVEFGRDDAGVITYPDGWTVFGGGESPGGLGTAPTTMSRIAYKRYSGANPPGFNVTSSVARHSGSWQVALQAALDPVEWDVYAADDLNGDRIATLLHARERMIRLEEDGAGLGSFVINRHSDEATAAILAKGNLVRVRIPEIGDDYIGGFFLEQGDFDILSSEEEGAEELRFAGSGLFSYLRRARMDAVAYSTGLDTVDTWTEVWRTSAIPNPVGACTIGGDATYLYVISATTRKVYKLRQSDRKVVATSPALWSGSTNYAGGLCEDPADPTVLWALESPWALGGGGNTKIRKIDASGAISGWNVSATFNLGSAVQLTDVEADATNLWTTKYDGPDLQKRSKATGAVVTSYNISYGGTAQTLCTGASINGAQIALWFSGKKRALIASLTDPETITDVIKTTGLSAFGGAWRTEGGNDYFYPVSYTADTVWKYQVTASTPHDPVDGTWRLDEPTPGGILWRTIVEATHVDRPQQPLPDLTFGFTATLDTDGNAWTPNPGTQEFTARIGDYLDETDLRLVPFGLTLQMSPVLELQAYNESAFGTDRTSGTFGAGKVRLVGGANIAEGLKRRMDERVTDSHMLVLGDANAYSRAVLDDLGYVREGFLSTNLTDATAREGTGDAELARQRRDSDAQAVVIPWPLPGEDPGDAELAGRYLPGPPGTNGHYWLGDTVRVHTGTGAFDLNEQDRDVKAITLTEPENGAWRAVADLAAIFRPIYDPVAPPSSGTSGSIGGTAGAGSGGAPAASQVTLKDSLNNVAATGGTLESEDIGVSQPAVGRVAFTVRRRRLAELLDAELDDLEDGQGIIWDASTETWKPVDLTTADGFLTKRGGEGHAILPIAISGTAVELDWSLANRFDVTLTDDPAITFAGLPDFGAGAEIGVTFRQDAAGGHAITGWPASVTFIDPSTGLGGPEPVVPTDPGASLYVVLATSDGGLNVGGSYDSPGAGALADLTDVSLSSLAELDTLRYVGGVWTNDDRIWRPLMDSLGNVITDSGSGDAIMALA